MALGTTLISLCSISRYNLCILGLSFIAFGTGPTTDFGSALNTSSLSQNMAPPSGHATFVSEFSGREDVGKELPPAVGKSIDIIFGPADPRRLSYSLAKPYAVATDSSHRVFVTDPYADGVHLFDFTNHKYAFLGGPDSKLRSPTGIAVDTEDNIYVTDAVLGVILVYDSKGKFLRYLGQVGKGEPYFQSPLGIAIDNHTGRIYVCDTPQHMLVLLDKQGHILGRVGKRFGGKEAGEFRYPSRVLTAGDEIVVLDSGNSRIQILDQDGQYRREFKVTMLGRDSGLALDAQKNIYLCDLRLNAIDVYSYSGKFLYRFGELGSEPGEFNEPAGMYMDSDNLLYVADTKNKRVQVFQIQ